LSHHLISLTDWLAPLSSRRWILVPTPTNKWNVSGNLNSGGRIRSLQRARTDWVRSVWLS
jgi:hypothetical protein